jgi:hypothetical protein
MKSLIGSLMFFVVSIASAHPYQADQIRIAAGGGGGLDGWSIGVTGGYFIVDSLELGLGSAFIKSEDLSIVQVTARSTYVFLPEASFNPYSGVFIRRWIVTSGDAMDQSSVGARFGLYSVSSASLVLGFGAAHEVLLNCDDEPCTSTYPEFSLALVF